MPGVMDDDGPESIELLPVSEQDHELDFSEYSDRDKENAGTHIRWAEAESLPTKLYSRLAPPIRVAGILTLTGVWLISCIAINNNSLPMTPYAENEPVVPLACGDGGDFWSRPNEKCGINGAECLGSRPNEVFTFRCPANCMHDGKTFQKTPIGTTTVERVPLVIGGDNLYRADSTLCAAALHHGAISNKYGGCARIKVLGQHDGFNSTLENGITSYAFDSSFVGSFEFVALDDCVGCTDRRIAVGVVSILASIVTGYLFTPAWLFLFTQCSIGFWAMYFGVDPPLKAGTAQLNAEIISTGFQRFMVTLWGIYVIYHIAARPQLENMQANLSRAIFWVLPFYVGILENYTFALLPIDRLLISDFNSQAGAWITVVILTGLIILGVVGQAFALYRADKFKKMLLIYSCILAVLLLLAMVPNETLRVHHYLLGLVFLPGTAIQTTPSLIYQGLCVGLFVSGMARWGPASILETSAHLNRNKDTDGETLELTQPTITGRDGALGEFLINWTGSQGQVSLAVNDVEIWKGNGTTFNLTNWAEEVVQRPFPHKFYVRVAPVLDDKVGAYTHAGVIDTTTNQWTPPIGGFI